VKIRKVYKTLGDPKYGYVEVTQEGGRCISLILFNEDDHLCAQLGYSLLDLATVTEYWGTRPIAGPGKQASAPGNQKAGEGEGPRPAGLIEANRLVGRLTGS
jgi:hypothetical protein